MNSTKSTQWYTAVKYTGTHLLLSIVVTFVMSGCQNEAKMIVETWESLADAMADAGDDCTQLASTLERFREENAPIFSSKLRPLYDEIAQSPSLRFRMEKAFTQFDGQLPCKIDPAVREQSTLLFGPLDL